MRASPSDRQGLLKRVQEEESDLYPELCSLVQTQSLDDSFWEVPLFDSRIQVGARLGPYRVLKVLGQGGMGTVYLAQQTHASQHRVALKVMAMPALDSASFQRFQAEQRLLARMSHSYIAKLHACGMTESGFPYFVMEFVNGENLSGYCSKRSLNLAQRLALFQKICEAVAHAHLKSVVHRDLKPQNILVIDEGGVAIPKIIDFGIAKSMEVTRHLTRGSEKPGTYRYMSPEQAGLRDRQNQPVDVDARSDVYALGVILYELLLGEPPLTWEKGTPFPQILHDICHQEIPHLWNKWLSLPPHHRQQLAWFRRGNPRNLKKTFHSDLNWILQKALAKNPEQRYRTPDHLAEDLARTTRHEAVRARPPGLRYLLTKFMRRHRLSLTLVATTIVVLTGFSAAMTVLQRKVVTQRDTAEEVITLLTDMFEGADPFLRGLTTPSQTTPNLNLNDILDRGNLAIQSHLQGQPKARARLMHTLGSVYVNLGQYHRAKPLLSDSLAIRRTELSPSNPSLAESLGALADWYLAQAQFDEAESLFQEALAIRKRYAEHQPTALARTQIQLALLYNQREDFDRAEQGYRQVLERFSPKDNQGFRAYADCLHNLALLVKDRGDFKDALCLLQHTLELDRIYWGEQHPYLAKTHHALALLHYDLNDLQRAEWHFREALTRREASFQGDHLELALNLNGLALTMQGLGDFEEAFRLHEQSLAMRLHIFGESHPRVATSIHNLGFVAHAMGDLDSASHFYGEALAIRKKYFGEAHSEVAESLHNLAYVYSETRRPKEAEPLFLDAIRIASAVVGEQSYLVASFKRNLGNHYFRYGQYRRAEPILEEAIAARKRILGADHPRVGHALCLLAEIQMNLQKWPPAKRNLQEAVEIYRNSSQKHPWRADYAQALWGVIQYREGFPAHGLDLLRKGVDFLGNKKGPEHETTNRLKKWYATMSQEGKKVEG